MKNNLIATSRTKQGLEKLINKFFYSNNWVLNKDLTLFNNKLNKGTDFYKVEFKNNRYRFLEAI